MKKGFFVFIFILLNHHFLYSISNNTQVRTAAFEKAIEFTKWNRIQGDILEFGTLGGDTASIFAKLLKIHNVSSKLHLFDSFIGLPEITSDIDVDSYNVKSNIWKSGGMSLGQGTAQMVQKKLTSILPHTRIHLHEGFFCDTFLDGVIREKPSIVHIDCDLYQSAKEVLSKLFQFNLVQDGLVILFDDYNCNRGNPNFGERRAFTEVMAANPNYSSSLFYYYGWHGAAFIIHDLTVGPDTIEIEQ